jgi:hypothetical protein
MVCDRRVPAISRSSVSSAPPASSAGGRSPPHRPGAIPRGRVPAGPSSRHPVGAPGPAPQARGLLGEQVALLGQLRQLERTSAPQPSCSSGPRHPHPGRGRFRPSRGGQQPRQLVLPRPHLFIDPPHQSPAGAALSLMPQHALHQRFHATLTAPLLLGAITSARASPCAPAAVALRRRLTSRRCACTPFVGHCQLPSARDHAVQLFQPPAPPRFAPAHLAGLETTSFQLGSAPQAARRGCRRSVVQLAAVGEAVGGRARSASATAIRGRDVAWYSWRSASPAGGQRSDLCGLLYQVL